LRAIWQGETSGAKPRDKVMRRRPWRGLFASLGILIVLGLSSCAPSVTPPIIEDRLVILSHSTYTDNSGYFRLVGEVENVCQTNTWKNKVIATFYDEQGVSNLTAWCYCYVDIIEPGDVSPFEIILPSPPDGVGYALTTECQATDTEANEEMAPSELEAMTDADGYYVVTGWVTNTSVGPIDVVMIIGSFYDSEETVVAVGVAFADVTPLQPDDTASFTMMIDPSISSKISAYTLQLVAYS
jgi:hypothetical protein